ncbi:DUF5994 family protein [Actinoplanes utahensis]|uniref:Uncharacterized protein n=1 Tax=Actinoplanes utahensis TaxID=1869 RepID=A0A0A6U8F1_ACTUT|nr:DUF5994 family protein [Actinoplanes utahensis]KHD72300.1 hypothetical protein MB27_37980 [Actinoplanes utahensis]GIF29660.1 hypothetical protein Aut01nite_26460 [Actinoplanes utahensis]
MPFGDRPRGGRARRPDRSTVESYLGWYASQPAGLVTVINEFGRDRFDLLVIPPDASSESADSTSAAAADASDPRRTPELLDQIVQVR